MMSDNAIAIEFAPNTPVQTERLVLENFEVREALKRILTRFGLPPLNIGFGVGSEANGGGDVQILGRNRVTNEKVTFGRVMFGASIDDLRAARQSLIDAKWSPTPPRFSMVLPNGRDVSTPTDERLHHGQIT